MQKIKSKSSETRLLRNLQDTESLAKEIAKSSETRRVIGLHGNMGSGKTHFVKALADELGLDGSKASSPTFAIHQEYKNSKVTLHHIDLFRLESIDEIESSGFWDLFYEDNVVIAIEWIDRISEHEIPENFSYLRLDWEILENDYRQVVISQFR